MRVRAMRARAAHARLGGARSAPVRCSLSHAATSRAANRRRKQAAKSCSRRAPQVAPDTTGGVWGRRRGALRVWPQQEVSVPDTVFAAEDDLARQQRHAPLEDPAVDRGLHGAQHAPTVSSGKCVRAPCATDGHGQRWPDMRGTGSGTRTGRYLVREPDAVAEGGVALLDGAKPHGLGRTDNVGAPSARPAPRGTARTVSGVGRPAREREGHEQARARWRPGALAEARSDGGMR